MIREDLSSKLVHLVRGDTIEIATQKFRSILREGKLRGGTGYIKGSYTCVCFTEAPISKLGFLLAYADPGLRYRPIGVMIDKTHVFDAGGRPVIYQSDTEFALLHESQKYRHVRFEPTRPGKPVDLTWEREWRVHTPELVLPKELTTIIVPTRHWHDVFVQEYCDWVREQVASGDPAAIHLIQPFPWRILVLEDLGVDIPDGLFGQ